MATNNAILNTIEILRNEVKQLKDLVRTLVTATTVTSLKNQNNDLKQGQTRLEQQIQKMGRVQREPAKHTATTPATSANIQPENPQRTRKQTPAQIQPLSTSNANHTPPQASDSGTWAKVARKGHEEKEKITGPPKKTEQTIVVHRNSEEINTEANIHHMRDAINNILCHNKAPMNLLTSGIQWNK